MENTTEVLLKRLLEEVELLNVETKAKAIQRFNKEFLTSDSRKVMYAAFDGEKSLQQISEELNCKINTLQIFAQMLIENDLVSFSTKGKSRILEKSISKIAIFYANKTLIEANVGE